MKNTFFILSFLSFWASGLFAQEMRGTWIARNSLSSKEALAYTMDSLAANNFNTVYVNVWSRGYPLWQSNVFASHTGITIDPTFAGRDIIAETIAEAHKHGLHVEAWFEYGFVGGWTGNQPPGRKGPVFDAHPDWVAKKLNGTEIDGSNFYWMIHTHPDVQNFLIDLTMEIVRNYDIDGIELDRIRYSSLEYGYDSLTVSLYKMENNGNPPPSNTADPSWIRWRADKLNHFMARIYDSVKTFNPHINISNAPSLYSSSSYTAYNTFCQDWVGWLNGNGMIDNVQVQSYVGSSSSFSAILTYIKSLVNDHTKVYPAFALTPGGNPVTNSTLSEFVNVTRQQGFKGNSIWYYTDLVSFFPYIKKYVYPSKTEPPHSPPGWRNFFQVVKINDTLNAVRNGSWSNSTVLGYTGQSLFTSSASSTLDYYFDVPLSGTYEIYVYNVVASNRNDSAKYIISDSLGIDNQIFLNQTSSSVRRWVKLGDFPLKIGNRKVITLSADNLKSGKSLSADAVMIILNRRLSPDVSTGIKIDEITPDIKKKMNFNLKSYPNPFNSSFKVSFMINDIKPYVLTVYNILGQVYKVYRNESPTLGKTEIDFSFTDLPTGVYFLELSQVTNREVLKLSFIK